MQLCVKLIFKVELLITVTKIDAFTNIHIYMKLKFLSTKHMEFYCEYILWFSFVVVRVFIECFGCTSIFDVFTDVWSCTSNYSY